VFVIGKYKSDGIPSSSDIYKHIYDYTLRHYDFTFVNPSSLITQRNVVDLTIMHTILLYFHLKHLTVQTVHCNGKKQQPSLIINQQRSKSRQGPTKSVL
jgi:aminopeptidase N